MAAHGSKPFVHVSDVNGNPYVGAKLYVYEVGTTNLRSIYSNAALSTPVSNPLTSDAAGNFARFYQASGTYKLRAETSAGALIWEYDNIDTGIASGNPLAVANGGTGATTATAARTNLGVPSTSELSDLASDLSDLASSIQNIAAFPQGYLTIGSLQPIIGSSDAEGGTSVYYTPYVGAQVPIYNGSIYTVETFSELTLSLHSNHTAGSIYDCFVIKDSGTLRLVTGPAWTTSTPGSGARGTGAGTTELERYGGLWVNKNAATMRYGATTLSVSARQGTYVGSIYIDAAAGQVSCHRTVGRNRKWAIWNAYNRQDLYLLAADPGTTWTYGTATWRASNNTPSSYTASFWNKGSGTAANGATVFCGLPEEPVHIEFQQRHAHSTGNGASLAYSGLAINGASGVNGTIGASEGSNVAGSGWSGGMTVPATHYLTPQIGLNIVVPVEFATISGSATGPTFYGTGSGPFMMMKVRWRG